MILTEGRFRYQTFSVQEHDAAVVFSPPLTPPPPPPVLKSFEIDAEFNIFMKSYSTESEDHDFCLV